jgi:hypothetical protein
VSVCLANIGPRQRRRRLIGGLAWLVVAIGTLVVVRSADAALPWRLTVFVPALLAAICLLQVQEKTCVVLAATGHRNLDAGNERITDEGERRIIQHQARRVMLKALAAATAATLVVTLL